MIYPYLVIIIAIKSYHNIIVEIISNVEHKLILSVTFKLYANVIFDTTFMCFMISEALIDANNYLRILIQKYFIVNVYCRLA